MKQSAPLGRSISMTALLLTVCLWIAIPWAGNAAQPLLVSTQGDTDEVFAFPDVGTGLPTPGASPLTLPGSTFPHGIAYASPTRALVCNISQSEVIAMDPSTNSILHTIDVSPSYAGGTVAISPDGQFALVAGERGTAYGGTPNPVLVTIDDPFGVSPTPTTVALPNDQIVEDYQTNGIVFDDTGRAFVATQHKDFNAADPMNSPNTSFVHVLDPPYTSIAFSMPVPVNEDMRQVAEGIALTPGGSQLLVASNGDVIWIFDAPFSSTPTVHTLSAPGQFLCTIGIGVAPDQQRAIVADCGDRILSVAAPFGASSIVESLTVPASATGAQFEHVAISDDGQLAVVTGGSIAAGLPMVVIEPPFTQASATLHAVPVGSGRGAGAARFIPTRLFTGGFELGDTQRWSAGSP
jgi:WD40 repeat protein